MGKVAWNLFFTSLSLLVVSCCTSFVSLSQDGGYENIVVAISPEIPEDEGKQLIINLTNLFKAASPVLHEATEERFYFKTVTFLIHANWTNIPNNGSATFEKYQAADVRVIPSTGNSGDAFTTLHTKGCGKPGEFIQITSDAPSTEINGAHKLVQNWAKYRYGVFEENGIVGSVLHPYQYLNGKSYIKTGCANPYPWNKLNECTLSKCHFDEDGNIKATTSLMDFENDKAQHFCNESTHKPEDPTIHNTLCRQKSVWQILKENLDFQIFSSPPQLKNIETNFSTVLATYQETIVVMDIKLCQEKGVQQIVTASIRNFLLKIIPQNANLSFLFGNTERDTLQMPMTKLDMSNEFTSKCDTNNDLGTHDLLGAINSSIEKLSVGGNLILMVSGDSIVTSESFIEMINNNEKWHEFYIFKYHSPLTLSEKWIDRVRRSDVTWYDISEISIAPNSTINAWKQLNAALFEISDKMSLSFSTESFPALLEGKSLAQSFFNGVFLSPFNAKIFFSMYSPIVSTQEISISLCNSSEKKIKPTNKWYEFEDTVQAGPCLFKIDLGKFKKIEFYLLIVLSAFDHPLPEVTIAIDQINPNFVILRVSVKRNGSALFNATVTATIDADASNIKTNIGRIALKDDGGSGDLLAEDGIYSHIIKPEKKGQFWVEVTVNFTGSTDDFVLTKIAWFTFEGDSSKASIPPNRIVDLGLLPDSLETADNYTAIFNWTAPAADYSKDKVTRYEFRCSQKRSLVAIEDLFNNADDEPLKIITEAKTAGDTENFAWDMKYNVTYFCAVRAFNEAGNHTLPSNIVTSYVPTPAPTTTTTSAPTNTTQPAVLSSSTPDHTTSSSFTPTPKSPTAKDGEGLETYIIIIIAVGICLVLILLGVLIWCLRFRKKKNSTAPHSPEKSSSSLGSTRQNNHIDRLRPKSETDQLDNSDIYGGFGPEAIGGGGDKSNGNKKKSNHDQPRSSVISEYASYVPEKENLAFEATLDNDQYGEGFSDNHTTSPRHREEDGPEQRGYLANQTRRTSVGSSLPGPNDVSMDENVYSEVDKSKKKSKSRPTTAQNKNVRAATQV